MVHVNFRGESLRFFLLPFRRRLSRPEGRGQSMVEFALLLPLLVVMFLGVADFGRVFQAGITMESAARAGAEAGALEYLRALADKPPTYDIPPDTYDHIREEAVRVVCRGAQLPNAGPSPLCPNGPAILVCIHDAKGNQVGLGDPNCGVVITGSAPVPAECWKLNETMINDSERDEGGTVANPEPRDAYVEVRTCYHFTTLFNLNISLPMNAGLSLGDIYLQRTAVFTVADY